MEREDYIRHFGLTLDEYTKRFGFDKMFKAMEDRIMHMEKRIKHMEKMGNIKDEIIETKEGLIQLLEERIETKEGIIQLLQKRLDYLQTLPIVREEQNKGGANRECTILYLNRSKKRHHDRLQRT